MTQTGTEPPLVVLADVPDPEPVPPLVVPELAESPVVVVPDVFLETPSMSRQQPAIDRTLRLERRAPRFNARNVRVPPMSNATLRAASCEVKSFSRGRYELTPLRQRENCAAPQIFRGAAGVPRETRDQRSNPEGGMGLAAIAHRGERVTEPTTSEAFEIGDALRFGWTATWQNLKPLLLIGAVGAFCSMLSQALHQHPFLNLGVEIVQAGVTMVYLRMALSIGDGRPIDLQSTELLRGFLPFLLTLLFVCVVVVAGLALLVVPGIIWGTQFGLATLVSVDRKLDPVECMRESSRLTRGSRSKLFLFWLAMLGVNLLGCLALLVGLFFTVPTTLVALAHVYRRLEAHAMPASPAAPAPLAGPSALNP